MSGLQDVRFKKYTVHRKSTSQNQYKQFVSDVVGRNTNQTFRFNLFIYLNLLHITYKGRLNAMRHLVVCGVG